MSSIETIKVFRSRLWRKPELSFYNICIVSCCVLIRCVAVSLLQDVFGPTDWTRAVFSTLNLQSLHVWARLLNAVILTVNKLYSNFRSFYEEKCFVQFKIVWVFSLYVHRFNVFMKGWRASVLQGCKNHDDRKHDKHAFILSCWY